MLAQPVGCDEVCMAMSEFRRSNDAPLSESAARCISIRDRMLVGLVLFTLVRASEALAGDQVSTANIKLSPDVNGLRQASLAATASKATPANFAAPAITDIRTFSTTDFRPRKRTLFDSDPTENSFADAPMLRGTTVWQRLSDYRSHNGVRLLTLWESSGSTVSLQAGRRGDPSLQWTSRLANHGGSLGLLDRLFSVSLARAGNSLRNATRSASAPATPTTASMPAGPSLK